jgi:hypothetical protein
VADISLDRFVDLLMAAPVAVVLRVPGRDSIRAARAASRLAPGK